MKGRLIPYTKPIGFNNNNNFHKLNENGLSKAYNNHNKVHVDNDTLYIAGTSNLRDVYDDITKIPIWGSIKDSQRYKDAKTVLDLNPHITNLVSHSLGSSVALELEKDNNKYKTTAYASPVLQFGSKIGNRYRFPYDPVSYLDNGAITVDKINFNPHSYSNY